MVRSISYNVIYCGYSVTAEIADNK